MNSRHLLFFTLGSFLMLLASCAPATSTSEETLELIDTASDLEAELSQIQSILADTGEQLQSNEGRLLQADSVVQAFVGGAQVHALGRSADIAEPPDGQVALRLSFTYLPDALPGDGIMAYEPTDEVNSLWAMESLAKDQTLPVGQALKDSILFFEPGETKTVTLAFRNPTAEDVGFLVLPHQESPGNLGAFVWPQCLCMSFTYQAPAEGSWYRVIKITLGPDTPAGSKIDSLWTVLTDPAVFPND